MKINIEAQISPTVMTDKLSQDEDMAWLVITDTLFKLSDATFTQNLVLEQLEDLLTSGQASEEFRKTIKGLLRETKEAK